MNRRAYRKVKNAIFLGLSMLATLTGLACLAAILWTLISHGVTGMSWHLFTQMTPPPGSEGGLLNALYGSGAMTLLGILIGSPIGVLAGTYLAEYGRNSRLSTLIRFINDVRLTYATNRPYGTNLPFAFSRISANQTIYSTPTDPRYPYYLQVRSGQAYAAATLSNAFMVDTDGSQFTVKSSDHVHFDTGGQQALGAALAQPFIGVLPVPQLASPAKSGNGWRVAFTGMSGLNYFVLRATSLSGPWLTLTNLFIGTSGAVYFDDPAPPASQAFYRINHP